MGKYYYVDTDYFFGNFFEPKWALICGELGEDGEKDVSTEEVVMWRKWEQGEGDLDFEELESAMTEELGFVPDYEIN